MDAPSPAVAAALARWRENLLDLTPHNPLLNLRPTRSAALTISHPAAGVIVEGLLQTGKSWSFWLPPAVGAEGGVGLGRIQTRPHELVCGDLERGELLEVLTRLHERAEFDRKERGVHSLHILSGLLEWHAEQDGALFRSPVLLLPVRIERSSEGEHFELVRDGDAEINPALRMRMKQEFDLDLPALRKDWDGRALASVLGEIDAAVAGLPGWRIDRRAVLTLLPFFKEAMHRDLEENLDRAAAHPLVRALAGEAAGALSAPSPEDTAEDNTAPAQNILHIADVDESQRACLEAAARGRSFLISGPPGSGKSQTIANVIADRLGAGKTVLFVSETNATKNAVCRHLHDAGLSDFCLDLHGQHLDSWAVLSELRRCLDGSPQPDVGLPAEEVEKLRQRGTELCAYVQALHSVREPLGQNARWALGELARCDGLPGIPLGLSDTGDLTADWLGQARTAVQRLQKLWHIRGEAADFPWWGFKADGHYTQKLRDEVSALLDRVRGRVDRLSTAARDYASKIGVTGPVPWLLRMADALETSPAPPASWLAAEDLSQLAADLERCASEYQQRDQAREPITTRYGADVWRLPAGTRASVEQSWRAVAPLLAPGDERGEGLLTHQQELRGWAADTQRRIPGWISDARTLAKWLGVNLPLGAGVGRPAATQEDPSVQTLKRLHRLANLCVTENAPERSWILDAGALEHARKMIDSSRPVLAAFHKSRAALLERYTEQLFELDLEGIARRFAGPYRSWLRVINMQFRRDRRALRRRCRAEALPRSWWQDVATAGDLMRQKAQLDAEQPARQAVLGRYEKSLATDCDAAERATRIAAEAVELARELNCSSLPGRLVEALSTTVPPNEKIRAALKRLHDSLGAWQHATEELKGYLPMDQLPGAGVPLEECALSLLGDYARTLQARLNQFAAAVDPVLAHVKTPPTDAVALLADLQQVEELRALEDTQEQDKAHWAAHLGSALKGVATDWNALRKALSWTVRVRELFKARGNGSAADRLPELLVTAAAAGAAAAPSSRELRQAKEQLEQSLNTLEHRFEPPGPIWQGKRYAELPLHELASRIDTLRARVGELADWIDWRHMPSRFAQLGLADFWEGLRREKPPGDRLVDVFTKAVLDAWLDGIFKNDPVLGTFNRLEHERILADYREVSGRLLRHNAQRIARRLASRRLQASNLESARLRGGQLTGEQVLDETPDLVLRLKPCLLTSPRSVSRFLHSPKIMFDVVVFDDASDIQVEDALGAIFRARQAVIAGDNEQPPPAHFASQWEAVENNAVDVPAVESLLSACLRASLAQYTLHEQYGDNSEVSTPQYRWRGSAPEPAPSPRAERAAWHDRWAHAPGG
jgi:hypothetical protein